MKCEVKYDIRISFPHMLHTLIAGILGMASIPLIGTLADMVKL